MGTATIKALRIVNLAHHVKVGGKLHTLDMFISDKQTPVNTAVHTEFMLLCFVVLNVGNHINLLNKIGWLTGNKSGPYKWPRHGTENQQVCQDYKIFQIRLKRRMIFVRDGPTKFYTRSLKSGNGVF
jgi:hypothetical protein